MTEFKLPYLRPQQMDPVRKLVPNSPRILRPKDYVVIDGDTIWALAPPDENGKRPSGFEIRLRAVSLPEKVMNTRIERAFRALGAPSRFTSGDKATQFLKTETKGKGKADHRCLLIIPSVDPIRGTVRKDRFNRLLADVYISGSPGDTFELANAKSVDHIMIENGYAAMNPSEKPAPHRAIDALANFGISPNQSSVSRSPAYEDPDM